MGKAGLLPLCRSIFAIEVGDNCIEILFIFVWMCPYYGDCCVQLVTTNVIQWVANFCPWIKALRPIFLKVFEGNMVLNISGYIIFSSSMLSSPHHTLISGALIQLLMLLNLHDLVLAIWSEWHKMSLYHPSWTCAAWYIETDLFLCRFDEVCHKQFCCLSCFLLYDPSLNWPFCTFISLQRRK